MAKSKERETGGRLKPSRSGTVIKTADLGISRNRAPLCDGDVRASHGAAARQLVSFLPAAPHLLVDSTLVA
jgi:hypothetical protein